MQIATGFWASKLLMAAVEFELFTRVSGQPMSALQLKKALGLQCTDRHVYDFLDALVALGFLAREGIWEDARYANTPDTEFFLVKSKPSYIGGMVSMLNHRLYGFWGDLEEGLRTGKPQNEAKEGGDLFEAVYADPDNLKEFILSMRGVQMGSFMAFAGKFDFSGHRKLVDVGGSSGMLSLLVARNAGHMECITWDLPPVKPFAEETIAEFGLQDRVTAQAGDFFKDALPKGDIVVMGNILHDWDEKTKLMLLEKAYEALDEGGCLVAIENVIDDERRQNAFGLMMSVNMLIETGEGFDYSLADFQKWAEQTGFRSVSHMHLAGPSSAAIAYK